MTYCQSCGMPMEGTESYGTEAGGAKTSEYCTYCYQEGAFVQPNMTMEEMAALCVPHMVQAGMSEQQAKELIEQTLPQLKRWKK